jgi:hypothetical protein
VGHAAARAEVDLRNLHHGIQQPSARSLDAMSSSLGCVYTVVVNGLRCLANRCARNRSLDAL